MLRRLFGTAAAAAAFFVVVSAVCTAGRSAAACVCVCTGQNPSEALVSSALEDQKGRGQCADNITAMVVVFRA